MSRQIDVFVDGSYQEITIGDFILGIDGYGIVIIEDENVLYTARGYSTDPFYTAHHNTGGEILAVTKALELIHSLDPIFNDCILVIHHDHTGVASWAIGEWKRNIDLTKKYREDMVKFQNLYNISFKKVKGHATKKTKISAYDKMYNTLADKLADRAVKDFINDHQEIDMNNLEVYERFTVDF